jgi:mono/diheme cytochrome c family protein
MRFKIYGMVAGIGLFVTLAVFGADSKPVALPAEPFRVAQATQLAGNTGAVEGDAQQRLIERGRYLAHDVAMCVICHSPKNDRGQVVRGSEFRGDAIPVDSPFPRSLDWADFAPALGPLVNGAETDVYRLLTTGIWPRTGKPAQGPMPPFRLADEDARAVIAYLKTVAAR